ncbi:MAG: tRNA uridine(34) 5-carboxymethylaminomethyl modification radical SAM/GNAT enzyme Elp3 [Methanobacteriaceae archaeon]
MEDACRLIINEILDGNINTKSELEKAKRQACRDFKLPKFMSNSNILEYASIREKKLVSNILKKKPTRTISGVAIVAVMCHPHKCPHGRCFYCVESGIAPPSYTGEEPAALRARMYNFSPYLQTYNRLEQLDKIGHPLDKIELIIMGGTFPSRDLCYQEWFVSQCLKAMTDFGIILDNLEELCNNNIDSNNNNNNNIDIDIDSNNNAVYNNISPKENENNNNNNNNTLNTSINVNNINDYYIKNNIKIYSPNSYIKIEDAQKANENSKVRCVGMTFETRPDYCKKEDINRMLNMGVTRVELGVQTIYDFVYKRMERGHTVKDVITSNQQLRDSGIKVCMHFMPGLIPNPDMDLRIFKEVFKNPNFKPDMIKIYPCLVTKNSSLYDLWEKGEYKPYTDTEAVDLIVKIKKILPKWVRTMRIQRDIPATLIEDGVQKSNLGELVYNRLAEENVKCQCIRCREIGHYFNKAAGNTGTSTKTDNDLNEIDINEFKIFTENYTACGGEETFISYEDSKEELIAGFLRLRFPSPNTFRNELTQNTAFVRELHVYGQMLKIGEIANSNSETSENGKNSRNSSSETGQHIGFGENLLNKAEEIAIKNNKDKMLIISGIGTRNYYRKFGYTREGPYMAKKLV